MAWFVKSYYKIPRPRCIFNQWLLSSNGSYDKDIFCVWLIQSNSLQADIGNAPINVNPVGGGGGGQCGQGVGIWPRSKNSGQFPKGGEHTFIKM